jgi:hypothetical protein
MLSIASHPTVVLMSVLEATIVALETVPLAMFTVSNSSTTRMWRIGRTICIQPAN